MSTDAYDPDDNARKCYEVAIEAMREKLAACNKQEFLDGKVALYSGDCLEVLKLLPGSSVDSVVCDPPYHLTSIVKRFGGENAAPAKGNDAYMRASRGFMNKQWDGGDIAFRVELWAEVLRVLKPGGHLVAFSGTRTYHRMACAIEDAGFEIRDQIGWVYGSGFPKSHDVSKGIDRAAGIAGGWRQEDHAGRPGTRKKRGAIIGQADHATEENPGGLRHVYEPGSDAAKQWQGWGTALKPAWEPICLARKPLIGTVAQNVLEHGTGAINIDGCRVDADDNKTFDRFPGYRARDQYRTGTTGAARPSEVGRWPANIVHDGSEEVLAAFPEAPGQQRSVTGEERSHRTIHAYGDFGVSRTGAEPRSDTGSAARFFYTAKADAEDRLGSKYPTVKPLDLMQWLVRLVTPKGGTVLDPFAGTGTTGEAAWCEGMLAVLIEREAEYQADISRRMELAMSPLKRAAIAKSKNQQLRTEGLPLFGNNDEDAA